MSETIPGYDPTRDADGAHFDEEIAQDAVDFFETVLKHSKGAKAGKTFLLEPWQKAIVKNLFGWIRPDGTRRYRESLIYVPRKNGKTEMSAAIICYLLFCDGEPGAQLYVAAADRDQAKLLFTAAENMIRQSEWMSAEARIYRACNSVVVGTSSFKALSTDVPTKHGLDSSGIIIDELHAQPNRELVDVLTTSTGARRQPLVVHITTSDYQRESICNEKYDYASKVRDGILSDPSFLPVIYEARPEDDWTSPEVWAKANPNLGVSLNYEYMARECQRAQESPSYENTFKRLHLNIKTEQDVRWLKMDRWDSSDGPVDEEKLAGCSCWCGLDLSTTTDISAFSMVFPDGAGRYDVLCRFWVPDENARQRERRDRVPYLRWISDGWITATSGDVIDYDVIRRDINELNTRFAIQEIAADRWNATQLITQLTGDGFTIFAFGQGFRDMTSPTKELEKLVVAGRLRANGNPVLRWMASNVSVEQDAAGNLKPAKNKSSGRIDGIVATIMGLARATAQPTSGGSIYDNDDHITFL